MPEDTENIVGRDRAVTMPLHRRYVDNLSAAYPDGPTVVLLRTFTGGVIRTFADEPIESFS